MKPRLSDLELDLFILWGLEVEANERNLDLAVACPVTSLDDLRCVFCSVAVDLSAAVQSGCQRKLVRSRGKQEPDESVRLHCAAAGPSTAAPPSAGPQLLATCKRFTFDWRRPILISDIFSTVNISLH